MNEEQNIELKPDPPCLTFANNSTGELFKITKEGKLVFSESVKEMNPETIAWEFIQILETLFVYDFEKSCWSFRPQVVTNSTEPEAA